MNKEINNPHFYEDEIYDKTFEELMNHAVGGIDKPKMHLWLPSSATQALIDLVKKIIGDDTGRDCKDTWGDVQ